jgi:hypothetical protein
MLCVALLTSACASSGRSVVATGPRPGLVDTATMADYLQRLPAGSKVRVEQTDGRSMRGTLMKSSAEGIVVQLNTRVAEPPIDIPVSQIARVTVDSGGGMSTGKAIGIGIASGVGAFFAILAIIAASFND